MGISDLLPDLLTEGSRNGEAEAREAGNDGDATIVIYECRHCGTTVTETARRCPVCDSTAIAEYSIE